MVHGTPNEEWTEKIKDVGLRGSAKIQKGDPFKGVRLEAICLDILQTNGRYV